MENILEDRKEPYLFSIFMCARNAGLTIKRAIDSVIQQTCKEWELLIVDNGSEDGTWEIIEEYKKSDSRVKGFRLNQGIGWAKGASLCLKHAAGRYMTFLAADDFLVGNGGLSIVADCIRRESADIIWVGHVNVNLTQHGYFIEGGIIPEYKVYGGGNKVDEIFEVMDTVYYNSFFHYTKIQLLRENGIDFFLPFYSDYEGMTEALCRAKKMVVLDQLIYALTANTSQTKGAVTWKHNVSQWRSVRQAVCEKGQYDRGKLCYIAKRIFNNNISMLEGICNSSPLKDLEMNFIRKTSIERLKHIEEALGLPEYCEMFYYAGRQYYAGHLLECAKNCYEQCRTEGYKASEIAQSVMWIDKLLLGLYQWDGEKLIKSAVLDKESLGYVTYALCHETNIGMFGYEAVEEQFTYHEETCGDWEGIFNAFLQNNIKQMYQSMFLAMEIKKEGRMAEVAVIVRECLDILCQIKDYIPQEVLLRAADDLKLVVNEDIMMGDRDE